MSRTLQSKVVMCHVLKNGDISNLRNRNDIYIYQENTSKDFECIYTTKKKTQNNSPNDNNKQHNTVSY